MQQKIILRLHTNWVIMLFVIYMEYNTILYNRNKTNEKWKTILRKQSMGMKLTKAIHLLLLVGNPTDLLLLSSDSD